MIFMSCTYVNEQVRQQVIYQIKALFKLLLMRYKPPPHVLHGLVQSCQHLGCYHRLSNLDGQVVDNPVPGHVGHGMVFYMAFDSA